MRVNSTWADVRHSRVTCPQPTLQLLVGPLTRFQYSSFLQLLQRIINCAPPPTRQPRLEGRMHKLLLRCVDPWMFARSDLAAIGSPRSIHVSMLGFQTSMNANKLLYTGVASCCAVYAMTAELMPVNTHVMKVRQVSKGSLANTVWRRTRILRYSFMR